MVGRHADHDQHDLRQFVDAERNEQDRQHRERDDLVEEKYEPQKELANHRKHAHVKTQHDRRNQQQHAHPKRLALATVSLHNMRVEESPRERRVVEFRRRFLFRVRLQKRVRNALAQLRAGSAPRGLPDFPDAAVCAV